MKIHFAYYNQFKNGIDIAFADNTLLFLSCVEAEKELHTTPNSQRLIDNLAIEDPLSYVAMALDGELQAWADAHLHQTIYISFLIIQSSLSQEIPVSIYLLKPYNSKLFFYHPLLHTGTICQWSK